METKNVGQQYVAELERQFSQDQTRQEALFRMVLRLLVQRASVRELKSWLELARAAS